MEKYKMLSGEEIVAKGATKVEVTLPEVGLKDVSPTGSWLEQKQIQSALEARKHLVEAKRIEKSGVLSHAEWREDLKLAEVIQQAGGYWQFMGHHKNHKLYLKPEEALLLIELNCLVLRFNEVIVSLQQAYSLLLSNNVSMIQYKVYASLSRLGYKVFRYNAKPASKEINETSNQTATGEEIQQEKSHKVFSAEHNDIDNTNDLAVKSKIKEVNKISDDDNVNNIEREESAISSVNIPISDSLLCQNVHQETTIIASTSMDVDSDNVISENLSNFGEESAMVIVEPDEFEVKQKTKDIKDNSLEVINNPVEQDIMLMQEKNAMEKRDFTETCEEMSAETISEIQLPEDLPSTSVQHATPASASTSMEIDTDQSMSNYSNSHQEITRCSPGQSNMTNTDPLTKYCQWKLDKLKNRQSKASSMLDIHKCFKDCPDMLENQIVTVNIPKEEYLPRNIFLNNLSYVINIQSVRNKNATAPYSLPDEVSGDHIRRVATSTQPPQTLTRLSVHQTQVTTSTHESQIHNRPPVQTHRGFPEFFQSFRSNIPSRRNYFWRPRPQYMTYYQFNILYQKYYMSNFRRRFQFYPRMYMPMLPRQSGNPIDFPEDISFRNVHNNNTRKRRSDHVKVAHLQMLKDLAQDLKRSCDLGNVRNQNYNNSLNAIQNLIQSYNSKFKTSLRLSEDYEIVNDETIVDTITLVDDDDEECRVKKARLEDRPDLFFENLNKIRKTASKLKKLEDENQSTSRHRRALSGVIKEFNKCFNADVYMTPTYEVLDRRYITLDSSSDSDCVVEERPKITSGKMLRNPFNILKKLSEKQSPASPSLPKRLQETLESPIVINSQKVSEESFHEGWLPSENDFGKPEIMPRDTMTARIIETKKEEFIYDFLKSQRYKYNNWTDIKVAFLESIEETNALFHTEAMITNNEDIKSLIKGADCTDMPTILNKLRVIKSNTNIESKATLTIDYDVYNRDVKNFRKANRPKPHFRVICIEQSTPFPSGVDIATLHANIEDNVATIFAVVGISSISYVQLKPTELPVYMPCNDLG